MGRSFFRPSAANTVEDYVRHNHYYHAPSDTHYVMLVRDGKYIQRRYQTGYDGRETNVEETQIDYVLGSGNHARTYLHRNAQGMLVELPLGWYSEKGGTWAMSPGYDNATHPGAQRPIGYDCLFCHNAYPKTAATKVPDHFGNQPIVPEVLPEGITCERCHGSAAEHLARAQKRGTILNPARLTLDRQMEVCLQCHLQPDSFRPTLDFKRYGKDWFSYTPAEPLGSFMQFFDSPGADRFQIAGSAYRLRQSACFLKSANALQCTTCHNPHAVQHGAAAAQSYNEKCRSCHGAGAFAQSVAAGRHTASGECTSCHMPKRRTQDVVHVVMTDHLIARRPAGGDLVAERAEITSVVRAAAVKPYYPAAADDALSVAVAQVRANAAVGVAPLRDVLRTNPPAVADPFYESAEAEVATGHPQEALALYREALKRDPQYAAALLSLGTALSTLQRYSEAVETLQKAAGVAPKDSRVYNALGKAQLALGHAAEAKAAFAKAVALAPEMASPHIGQGILAEAAGASAEAAQEFREAIRLAPNASEAHGQLGNLLIATRDFEQAAWEFDQAVRYSPKDATFRMRYATLLYTLRRLDEAQVQIDAALQAEPQSAEAHHTRGNILEQKKQMAGALQEYREAVRLQPGLSRAQLDLGAVLAQSGDKVNAAVHLKLAAQAEDPNVRRLAAQLLSEL